MSMKLAVAVFSVVVLLPTMSVAQVSVEDLEGTWTGPIDLSFLLVLTENGVESRCRSSLTPECEKSLPEGAERVVIENGTFSISFISLVGVNTTEKSAAMFPECAASGVFPFETITPLPPAEIQSYDPVTGHLTFIDSRRPEDLNCVILTLDEGEENVPSTISLKYILTAIGTLAGIVEIGPSFRCVTANGVCINQLDEEGVLTAYIDVEFELPCVEGPCLAASERH